MNAVELFARSQSAKTEGPELCHWCGSSCNKMWVHDDLGMKIYRPGPAINDVVGIPDLKRTTAKRPGDQFICIGCWLYRRKRITITFLSGRQVDRKEACNYSWWITEEGAWGLEQADAEEIYLRLLNPPHRFVLSLLDHYGDQNLLHLACGNDHIEIKADTPLTYTLNNKAMKYTVYELEEAMKHGTDGKSPGVRALLEFFGPSYRSLVTADEVVAEEKRNRGRPSIKKQPPDDKPIRRVVTNRSGM